MRYNPLPVHSDFRKPQFDQSPVDALADLAPHFAEPGPTHPQLGEQPLQELYAIGVLHAGERNFTAFACVGGIGK
jgi:hypothetical protein